MNLIDDEIPETDNFEPDGGYVPRMLFFDPQVGKVHRVEYLKISII